MAAPAARGRARVIPPGPAPAIGEDPDAAPATIAEVLVPVAVDQTYSYRVPPDIAVEPGASVEVPLGTRRTLGLVFELRSVPGGGANLKAVTARLPFPVLRQPLLDFIDWVARWTTMPRGMVLRMAVRPMAQDGTSTG